jgi:ubiquinone/menaquinone biosynthesis C-methylase UbiE
MTRKHLQPHFEVLEIGCGTGGTAILHAPYVDRIVATDLSARMLDIGRDKARAAGIENVTFRQTAVEDIDAADASFDAVLALSLLHLLDERAPVLRSIHRWLKPGGIFVSSTAVLGDTMRWFRFIGPIGHRLGLIPMVRIFSRGELEASIADAGFEIIETWQPGKTTDFIIARRPD